MIADGVRLFTPTRELNSRTRAECTIAAALPALAGAEWAKTKRALGARRQLLTFLDRARPPAPPTGDEELLHGYRQTGDSVAFADLVRRHGPWVFGACPRGARRCAPGGRRRSGHVPGPGPAGSAGVRGNPGRLVAHRRRSDLCPGTAGRGPAALRGGTNCGAGANDDGGDRRGVVGRRVQNFGSSHTLRSASTAHRTREHSPQSKMSLPANTRCTAMGLTQQT